ncbi:hypothetical protein [Luteolibacter soli]|uniref:Leucine-rich repeat domain-containing protein n=1 Tax=Luteolibacter soli TaxID=3135280 RepID=A0ABU9AUR3_9BACT
MKPPDRIQNPTKIDRTRIEAILTAGKRPTIQFDDAHYNDALLNDINGLCRIFGDELEIRFYGHYQNGFDGKWLTHLPDVAWLSLDCLTTMRSTEYLADLANLRKLAFAVFESRDPKILEGLCLEQLVALRIGESRKLVVDLGPLERCGRLESLNISAQNNGLEVVSRLSTLQSLSLCSIARKIPLPRTDLIPSLRKMLLILGGREEIDGISSNSLEELDVIRVRGLSSVGNLARFPSLKYLTIEDQAQLATVDLGNAPETLEKLMLVNCKSLADLGNLQALPSLVRLEKLCISNSVLDLEDLLAARLPASLRSFGFWTRRAKEDRAIRTRLDALGYDAQFWS